MEEEIKLIEKFEKIIKENKYEMIFLFILYNMQCHRIYKKLSDTDKYQLMNLIYEIYLDDERQMDIAIFSDTIMANYKKALNGEITKYNIYNFIEGGI